MHGHHWPCRAQFCCPMARYGQLHPCWVDQNNTRQWWRTLRVCAPLGYVRPISRPSFRRETCTFHLHGGHNHPWSHRPHTAARSAPAPGKRSCVPGGQNSAQNEPSCSPPDGADKTAVTAREFKREGFAQHIQKQRSRHAPMHALTSTAPAHWVSATALGVHPYA